MRVGKTDFKNIPIEEKKNQNFEFLFTRDKNHGTDVFELRLLFFTTYSKEPTTTELKCFQICI